MYIIIKLDNISLLVYTTNSIYIRYYRRNIMENINILIVDNRKFYELTCIDIDDTHKINIIHRNSKSHEHYIELDINDTILNKYRETYLKLDIFDTKLKGMSSYKISELTELCKKLNINIENKKMLKKDIYERLVQNY